MARGQKKAEPKNGNGAKLNFEQSLGCSQTLWASSDKLQGHMDAAEYKHVVLGLIFLKYISDTFSELYNPSDLHKDLKADFILANPPCDFLLPKLISGEIKIK